MQTRLNFYASGPEAMNATTGPEEHLTQAGKQARLTTPSFMARLACSAVLCIAAVVPSPVLAAAPLAAGFETLQAADGTDKPLEVAIFYPTEVVPQEVDLGPFRLNIARGGAVAGQGLPLIVISHGNGGATLSHHDTAIALAQAGFVVAAVQHTGDNHADQSRAASMMDRPRHISRVIDHMLTQWSGKDRIDATRIGVFGHSSGAFTALAIVGGTADLRRIAPHCKQRPGDYPCQLMSRQPAGTAARLPPCCNPTVTPACAPPWSRRRRSGLPSRRHRWGPSRCPSSCGALKKTWCCRNLVRRTGARCAAQATGLPRGAECRPFRLPGAVHAALCRDGAAAVQQSARLRPGGIPPRVQRGGGGLLQGRAEALSSNRAGGWNCAAGKPWPARSH